MTKISVVTPSYNQADYIRSTIESVLFQEGNFEIEYFIMDGGSHDGSINIIRSYSERLESGSLATYCRGVRLYWVSEPDRGQADAINKGLRQATGDICAYINSDDLFFPGTFQHVTQMFEEFPQADFIYGDGDVIDENGNLQWEWLSRPYNHRLMISYHYFWNDFTNYIMQQAVFWRRTVMDRIGYFDESFHFGLDVEYWIRAGDAGLKLVHVPHKYGKFRMVQGTKSLSSPVIFWQDYMEIFRKYRKRGGLDIFFCYYYYNHALHNNFDHEQAFTDGNVIFSRWTSLSATEQMRLEECAARGWRLSCLLTANELWKIGDSNQSFALYLSAIRQYPSMVAHPFSLVFLVYRVVGKEGAKFLESWASKVVELYRKRKIDYRYGEK